MIDERDIQGGARAHPRRAVALLEVPQLRLLARQQERLRLLDLLPFRVHDALYVHVDALDLTRALLLGRASLGRVVVALSSIVHEHDAVLAFAHVRLVLERLVLLLDLVASRHLQLLELLLLPVQEAIVH